MKTTGINILASSLFAVATVLSSCSGSRVHDRAAAYAASTDKYVASVSPSQSTSVDTMSETIPEYTWIRLSAEGCGYSLLTDDLIASNLRGHSATFPVIIEEALECPGLYRLINPLKAFTNTASDNREYNLVIDATDPSKVTVARQNTGVDLGNGTVSIESLASRLAALGNPDILIQDAGYYGRLENGEITFASAASFMLCSDNGSEKSTLSGTLRIVLPEKVSMIEQSISKADYGLGVEYLARVNGTDITTEINPAALSTDAFAFTE